MFWRLFWQARSAFSRGCIEDVEEELVSVEDVIEVEDLLESESELDVLRSGDGDELEGVLGRFLRGFLIFFASSLIRAVRRGDVGEWQEAGLFAVTCFLGLLLFRLTVRIASFSS